ncbi:MAG TPA: hypothetical protein VLS87_07360 [Woeseiaceae bacterium]|nr:hypothetical protein [Woeseiaceae bacterium]
MNLAEQLAAQAFLGALAGCTADTAEQPGERRGRGAAVFTEFTDRHVPAGGDAVAPAFRVGEDPFRQAIVGFARAQRLPDRFRVRAAHQLADELFLPAQRTVRAYFRRGEHGIAQALVDRQRLQFVGGEADQAFAQLLQFELLSFSR